MPPEGRRLTRGPACRGKSRKRGGGEFVPPPESSPRSRRAGPRPRRPRIRARGPPRPPGPGAACQAAASTWPQAGQERPEAAGGEGRAGVWRGSALLTCWYRLPQAGSTAASAANANAMAQPGARTGGRAGELKGRGRRGRELGGRGGRASGGCRWPPPLPGKPLSSGCECRGR